MLNLDAHILIHALQGSLTARERQLLSAVASTSIVHRVPLVTRDGKIRKSKLVPLAK